MELLASIPLIGGPLAVILPFLVVLAIVVAVHEYGHYIVGRWCGIGAEVFSIGFGPRLVSWVDKRGTRWQVAALPLGGFVKFTGDMDPASAGRVDDSALSDTDRRRAFHNAPLWARAITVFAGPAFNFALSIIVFTAISLNIGTYSKEPVIGSVEPEIAESVPLEAGDRVLVVDGEPVEEFGDILDGLVRSDGRPVTVVIERAGQEMELTAQFALGTEVVSVTPGMPASQAGMMPRDEIISIDGQAIGSFYQLQLIFADKKEGEVAIIEALRDGEKLTFEVLPVMMERSHPVTQEETMLPTIGVRAPVIGSSVAPELEPVSIGQAVEGGLRSTWRIITGTVHFLGDLIFADADPSQLGGPIKIAQISSEKAEEGAQSLIYLIAVISTSIGLLNLFPIPILDGGHLVFYAIEWVRGRPVGDLAIKIGTMVGLSLVLLLMVFATYNDLRGL